MAKLAKIVTPSSIASGTAVPPFAALKAFIAVGQLGGIRKAATALHLDHTVVSRHIRSLELWLGVSLFNRSDGRLGLTEAGETYHRRISAAVLELAAATADLRQEDDYKTLRLWCVPGFAAEWLSDQIAEFDRLWPEIGVEFRPTDHPADLIMHEADIDVRFYGDDWLPRPGGKGLKFIEIARPPIMAVASPDLAARLSRLAHVSDLIDAPLLHEEHHEQWRAWLASNDVVVPEQLPGQLLWHAHLAIAAARQGRGIALASSYLVAKYLNDGSLVELSLPGSRQTVIGGYAFSTREDRWRAPPILKLRRFLQAKALPSHA